MPLKPLYQLIEGLKIKILIATNTKIIRIIVNMVTIKL